MTSPTEQLLREIKERLSAADMKQYARHPDYWEMAECELSDHAPEDLAKLIQIVEVQAKALRNISSQCVDRAPPFRYAPAGVLARQAEDALAKADAIAKGDE